MSGKISPPLYLSFTRWMNIIFCMLLDIQGSTASCINTEQYCASSRQLDISACYSRAYVHKHIIASREAPRDCILKMFSPTFLHAKAKFLLYLYIFYMAAKECPISDVSHILTFFPANSWTYWFRLLAMAVLQDEALKMGLPAAISRGRKRLRRERRVMGRDR